MIALNRNKLGLACLLVICVFLLFCSIALGQENTSREKDWTYGAKKNFYKNATTESSDGSWLTLWCNDFSGFNCYLNVYLPIICNDENPRIKATVYINNFSIDPDLTCATKDDSSTEVFVAYKFTKSNDDWNELINRMRLGNQMDFVIPIKNGDSFTTSFSLAGFTASHNALIAMSYKSPAESSQIRYIVGPSVKPSWSNGGSSNTDNNDRPAASRDYTPPTRDYTPPTPDPHCPGYCASEQGMCMGQCLGNGPCIGNCAAAHGRCISRCN